MSPYHPLVSIIINTHNSIEYLKEAIDSAYEQTYDKIEIVVYDNASSVGIKEVVDQYDSRLQYYRSDKFLTLGQARNEALKLVKGELIDFLDADDQFLPNKLEKQVPLFADPKVGLVFCNSEHFKEIDGKIISTLNNTVLPPEGQVFENLLKSYFISWDSAIFRKSAIGADPAYWFNEYFNICTDYDLFLRMAYHYEFRYIDQPLSRWRQHDNNWSKVHFFTLPLEKLAMIPRILQYEPQLFTKYRKEINWFIGLAHWEYGQYYWQCSLKKEAWLCGLHSLFLSFRASVLLKTLLLPFCSYQFVEKLAALKRRVLKQHYAQELVK